MHGITSFMIRADNEIIKKQKKAILAHIAKVEPLAKKKTKI
jgi:hypothetical protein